MFNFYAGMGITSDFYDYENNAYNEGEDSCQDYLELNVPDELDLHGSVVRFASEFLVKRSDTRDTDGGEDMMFRAIKGVRSDLAH